MGLGPWNLDSSIKQKAKWWNLAKTATRIAFLIETEMYLYMNIYNLKKYLYPTKMKYLKGVSMAFFALAQSSGSSLAFIRLFNFFLNLLCFLHFYFVL